MRYPFVAARPVTQVFGNRHPRYLALGMLGHNGIDFGALNGEDVFVIDSGECVEAAHDPDGYGFYVKLRTPAGEDWLYGHLHPWHLPQPGEWLGEGARLGHADNSGLSTGVHTHIGYRPRFWDRGGGYFGYVDWSGLLANITPAPIGAT